MTYKMQWLNVSVKDTFEQISTRDKQVKTKDCLIKGDYPVVDQGRSLINGFVNDETKVINLNKKPIVIFGDHTRIIKWINFNFVPGADGTKLLMPKEFLIPRFFYYQLKSIDIKDRGYVRHFKILQESNFKVAPLAVQQEIVRQLDVMLAQVEQIKARLDAIPAILKKFRQSVLADAVSGRLTEEWRSVNPILESASEIKEKWLAQTREKFNERCPVKKFKEPSLVDDKYMPWDEITNDWDLVSVSEFAECLDNLRVLIKKDDRNSNEGLYPYFGANGEVDRVDEFIIDDDIVLVTEDETFYGRTKPIAYRYYGKCWVNNHVHVLKAPTREANDYLCYALMYYHVIPWLTGTTGRAKLSQAALNSLPLLMPPVKEIEVIVANVNKLLEHAEKIENVIQSAQKRVNLLTQSILAKAFSGELTAEWREQHQELITGINSAESLLAKIQAEREASKPAKKTRKKKEV